MLCYAKLDSAQVYFGMLYYTTVYFAMCCWTALYKAKIYRTMLEYAFLNFAMLNYTILSGCSIMEKIIITIILVNIEFTIIQTIIFEVENMMYLFSMSLPKTLSTLKCHLEI